jgi:hypothetical protein
VSSHCFAIASWRSLHFARHLVYSARPPRCLRATYSFGRLQLPRRAHLRVLYPRLGVPKPVHHLLDEDSATFLVAQFSHSVALIRRPQRTYKTGNHSLVTLCLEPSSQPLNPRGFGHFVSKPLIFCDSEASTASTYFRVLEAEVLRVARSEPPTAFKSGLKVFSRHLLLTYHA